MKRATIYSDGAARGNPGPAASAFTIEDEAGKAVKSGARPIGKATNNVAEYTALIDALREAASLTSGELTCISDSKLMVSQLRGEYRIKKPHLRELLAKAKDMEKLFLKVSYRHVSRENPGIKRVDRMVNHVLDRSA
jgi:ribonuclease HI